MYGFHRWNLEEKRAKVERVGGFDTTIPGRECQDLTWMKPAEGCALERPVKNCNVQDRMQQYAAWRTPTSLNDSGHSLSPRRSTLRKVPGGRTSPRRSGSSEVPGRSPGPDRRDRRGDHQAGACGKPCHPLAGAAGVRLYGTGTSPTLSEPERARWEHRQPAAAGKTHTCTSEQPWCGQ